MLYGDGKGKYEVVCAGVVYRYTSLKRALQFAREVTTTSNGSLDVRELHEASDPEFGPYVERQVLYCVTAGRARCPSRSVSPRLKNSPWLKRLKRQFWPSV